MQRFVCFALLLVSAIHAEFPPEPVEVNELVTLFVYSPTTIRVAATPTAAAVHKTSVITRQAVPKVQFTVERSVDEVNVTTSELLVRANVATGAVSFCHTSGEPILQETGREFVEVEDLGKQTYSISQSFASPKNELLYGGGQYQNGFLQYRGAPLQLIQFNTEAIVPFFVSSLGYGIYWDNYAWSWMNKPPLSSRVPLVNGSVVHNSYRYADKTRVYRWGVMQVTAGDHFVYAELGPYGSFGSGVQSVRIWAEPSNVTLLEWQELTNCPAALTNRVALNASTLVVHIDCDGCQSLPNVSIVPADSKEMTLSSALGDLVDYYFIKSSDGSIDSSVAGYRQLTGSAPLFGKWAYGFWQCKEHYHNRSELVGAAKEFRARSLPVDNIVQDWLYWGSHGWGPEWDTSLYPDPKGMVEELHGLNYHFMVSVWSKFANKEELAILSDNDELIPGTSWFDPTLDKARQQFYDFVNASMFSIGVDALWLDATEPENFPNENNPMFIGSGNANWNTYSFFVTGAVADNLDRDYPNKRVFSLTRSSFAGQQRNRGVVWSGDIYGGWESYRRQISASINFGLSGMPYWSEDIGGFFRPGDQYTSPDYHNLLTRWFQFGAFTPIFRVHGGGTNTEYWNFGPEVEKNVLAVCNLRYRLLPYIYSLAYKVATDGYTMQRGLVFDFPHDDEVAPINDEFTFGPSLLVAPVVQNVTQRDIYLPKQTQWIDFWTGNKVANGWAQRDAPIETVPLYVPAGAILPMGPFLQYSSERPADPLEIRLYAGGDGATFEIYEDDGQTRGNDVGEWSSFRLDWDGAATLNVSDRTGSFPGMLTNRTFNVVLVQPGQGGGLQPATVFQTVHYNGDKLTVNVGATMQ